jgi:hypothetical protein
MAGAQASGSDASPASRLGGSYSPVDRNHAHTPLQILGLKDGKPVVIATE